MLKAIIKQITPPIFITVARKLLPAPSAMQNCSGRFTSYEEAYRVSSSAGYEDDLIIRAVHAKTLAYKRLLERQTPLANTPPLERVLQLLGMSLGLRPGRNELTVIDLGGALGTHYLLAKALLGDRLKLRWHVVETPAMCRHGADFANDELRFYDDLSQASADLGEPDVAYTDGVFQTVPEPRALFQQFLACGARLLSVRRTPFTEEARELITVLSVTLSQHAPALPLPANIPDRPTPMPLTALPRSEVEGMINQQYEILLRGIDYGQVYRGEGFALDMYSYFCERR